MGFGAAVPLIRDRFQLWPIPSFFSLSFFLPIDVLLYFAFCSEISVHDSLFHKSRCFQCELERGWVRCALLLRPGLDMKLAEAHASSAGLGEVADWLSHLERVPIGTPDGRSCGQLELMPAHLPCLLACGAKVCRSSGGGEDTLQYILLHALVDTQEWLWATL